MNLPKLSKGTNKYNTQTKHNRYGIINWLVYKKFIVNGTGRQVDKDKYRLLLNEFCLIDNPNFITPEGDTIIHLEKYIQNRFNKFCNFCINKFKNNDKSI